MYGRSIVAPHARTIDPSILLVLMKINGPPIKIFHRSRNFL